jgi:hypothetical protein
MSAVAALAAPTPGVAGTTAAQATEHRETEAAAPATDGWRPEFEFSSHEAFVSYLNSAEGRQPLREEGLAQARSPPCTPATTSSPTASWTNRRRRP